jgi:hypothetical protein
MAFVRSVKQIVKWFIPYGIVECRKSALQKKQEENEQDDSDKREQDERYKREQDDLCKKEHDDLCKRKQIKRYFLDLDKSKQDKELVRIIEHLEAGFPLSVFPYPFPYQYDPGDIETFYDASCNMKYVLHCGKRMYFPETWNYEAIRGYHNSLLIEQDPESPHRYETPDFRVKDGDAIADIGAAEGIWALTYAEKAAKIYLFECEAQWISALEKTFEPWKEKVAIVNKYISNVTDKNNVTLDDFLCGRPINVIKADIEGAEMQLLEGAENVLTNQNDLKLLLCTYHRKDDDARFKTHLEKRGFQTEYSNGYMLLFMYDPDLDEPYTRRGLIRAMKR